MRCSYLLSVLSLLGLSCFGPLPDALQAQEKARPLDAIFTLQPLWGADRPTFMKTCKEARYRWVSAAKQTARAAGTGLTFAGLPVTEALVRFDETGLKDFTFNFYNRGDAGTISEEAFETRVADCRRVLAAGLGGPGAEREEASSIAVDSEAVVWEVAGARFVLDWSFQKEVRTRNQPFRAEFIRLNAAPIEEEPETFSITTGIERPTSDAKPEENVVRKENGDILLANVPMVDQGQKGYCVTASVERVLRYYGAAIDQHEIAQLADGDAERGTSINAMIEAMERISNRTGVRVEEHYMMSFRDFQEMVEDYNREARRADLPELYMPTAGIIDVTAIYSGMKPAPFREARLKAKSDYGRFQRDIEDLIDQGYPGVWSVMLGLIPEKPALPQAFGGHMRLIIGYNTKTEEILYTDSWGRGHELKRMPMADAWAITKALSSLEPF